MSDQIITGSTEVAGIGTVHWTAKQLKAWGGEVVRTILVDADGPNGALTREQMNELRAAEPRLR